MGALAFGLTQQCSSSGREASTPSSALQTLIVEDPSPTLPDEVATMHYGGRGSAHWMWGRDSDQAELGNFTSERQPDMEAVTSRKRWDYQEKRAGQPQEAPYGSHSSKDAIGLCSGGGSRARPAPEAGALAGHTSWEQDIRPSCHPALTPCSLSACWQSGFVRSCHQGHRAQSGPHMAQATGHPERSLPVSTLTAGLRCQSSVSI